MKVIENYEVCYTNPLNLKIGEKIQLYQKDVPEKWRGWNWCKDSIGNEGWISETYFKREDFSGVITKAYYAKEISAQCGDEVDLLYSDCGWAWCRNKNGVEGWLPMEILEQNKNKRLFVASTKSDLERCYPIMKELRPHLTFEDYISIYESTHKADGYEIVGIEEGGEILAVMGYRVLYDFVRGKHIYVDDLVSTEKLRSKGLGTELLKYAEGVAKELGCSGLRLCTGIENERGIKFYDRNGWTKRAFAYTKKLEKPSIVGFSKI